ncbi:hypothetical protein GWI33_002929 [Rhynchophorus ferrugineus]|uniref:Uncharacterized protein n=1 Tax=Rhynchophorus ferrugineus TaxID=354439 RepID=A0A834ILZ5_RHYFE|nr:hypothetical protein GWI33_002929 [Rhynchophorus ferrugineus]
MSYQQNVPPTSQTTTDLVWTEGPWRRGGVAGWRKGRVVGVGRWGNVPYIKVVVFFFFRLIGGHGLLPWKYEKCGRGRSLKRPQDWILTGISSNDSRNRRIKVGIKAICNLAPLVVGRRPTVDCEAIV